MIGIPAVESDQFSRFEWKDIQKALNDIGFDAGESDGIPGFKTRSAIKLFQESRGFPIGELTLGQRERLFSDAREADLGRLGTTTASDTDLAILPEMIEIPAGCFEMGGKVKDDEQPQHRVCLKRFAIGKYEVTFDQYDRFAEATVGQKPSDEGWGRGDHPVINISREDAVAYAEWLSKETGRRYRLPTEAEWEYAARAGTTTRWSFGDDEDKLDEYAWYRGDSGGKTHEVGKRKPNPLGLYDVHGNVLERVQDCWHVDYNDAPVDGSAWLESDRGDCELVVFRGGSWFGRPENLRSATRFRNSPYASGKYLGFRLAQDIE